MARTISKEGLEQKMEKVQIAIARNREQYDKLTAELEELHQKQKAIQSEELLKAIAESARSYEEILEFIQGKDEGLKRRHKKFTRKLALSIDEC